MLLKTERKTEQMQLRDVKKHETIIERSNTLKTGNHSSSERSTAAFVTVLFFD